MEMHSVANLATLLKKKCAQTLFRFWDPLVLPREHEVLPPPSLSLSLSLSLSVCVCLLHSEHAGTNSTFS